MKSLVAAFGFLFVTSNSFAEVAKPANPLEAARGVALINNVPVNYEVHDRGWTVVAEMSSHVTTIEGTKSFLMFFNAEKSLVSAAKLTDREFDQLEKEDAKEKCEELGRIELADQASNAGAKIVSRMTSEIESFGISREGSTKIWSSFNCIVKIYSQGM